MFRERWRGDIDIQMGLQIFSQSLIDGELAENMKLAQVCQFCSQVS